MEEGPEPQEWVEKVVEHHEHQEGHGHEEGQGAGRMTTLLPAITAATLAVLAALGSLLSGHAANQAILFETQAADKWAYYQAKSTKEQIYEASLETIRVLSNAETKDLAGKISTFQGKIDRYAKEKDEIKLEAEHLEAESRHEFHKHHQYAIGIALFQVGIVMASVSILVRYKALWALSILGGVVGVVFIILGLIA